MINQITEHFKKRLIQDESGQSMVEFALVLPILILLTVGTLYLTISFTHKSRLNGLAYMSARSAAVQPKNKTKDMPAFIKGKYAERGKVRPGNGWLGRLQMEIDGDDKEVKAEFKLSADPKDPNGGGGMWDLLANSIDIIGGKGSYSPRQITARVSMPRENFDIRQLPRLSTTSVVSYRFSGNLNLGGFLPIQIPLDRFGLTQMADDFGSDLSKKKRALGLKPPNKKISEFYQYVNWIKKSQDVYDFDHNEEEEGRMERAKLIGEHFKLIETSGRLADISLTLLSPFLGDIKDIIGDVVGEVAAEIEVKLNQTAKQVDLIQKDYLTDDTLL